MNELTQTHIGVTPDWKSRERTGDHSDVWAVFGAGAGLAGGVLAPILGAILSVVSWMAGNNYPGPVLHKVGTVCFFLTAPLLVFGGYCLDVLEKRGWKIA